MAEEDLKFRISLEDLFTSGIEKAGHHAEGFDEHVISIREHISSLTERAVEAFGIFEAWEFGKESASDFIAMQKAQAELEFTANKRGNGADDFRELQEEAEKLGKTSFFSTKEIDLAENKLLNFGISIKQTREGIEALTNAGVGKGKSLDEVISSVSMAAAGGRAMALKEYGLGYLKLEKDMSVSGAEARNFLKIITAIQKEFSGANEFMSSKEFYKIKAIQKEMEEFREHVGKNLLKAFDLMLPFLKKAIQYMEEFGHFVKENKDAIMPWVAGIGAVVGAILTFNTAMKLAEIAVQAFEFATSITWMGGIAIAIGLIAAGWYEAAHAHEEYEKSLNKRANEAVEAEKRNIQNLIDKYTELGESKQKAQEHAVAQQRELLTKYINDAQNDVDAFNTLRAKGKVPSSMEDENVKNMQRITELTSQKSALNDPKILQEAKGKSEKPEDSSLGSGLSEPKGGSIKNITININDAFKDQKITMGGGSMNARDIAPALLEFLVSMVQDSAIIATE